VASKEDIGTMKWDSKQGSQSIAQRDGIATTFASRTCIGGEEYDRQAIDLQLIAA
jgi:hypothetical protein